MRFLYLRWGWKRTRWTLLVITVVYAALMLIGLAGLPRLMRDQARPDRLGDVLALMPMIFAMFVNLWTGSRGDLTFRMTRPVSWASLIWTPWLMAGAESAAGMLVCMALVSAKLWGHPGMEVIQFPTTWLWVAGGVVNGLILVGMSLLLARVLQGAEALSNLIFFWATRVPWLLHLLFVWPRRGSAAFSMRSLWLHLALAVGLAAVAQWWLERSDVPLPGVQLTSLRR